MSGGASSFLALLQSRATENRLHIPATIIFALAIAHTLLAARFTELAHAAHRRHAAGQRATGRPLSPGVLAEVLHLLGEVEVIFGLWVVPLIVAMAVVSGWSATTEYLNTTVDYTEALFVVVIMALASTRPIVTCAEGLLRAIAAARGGTAAAWWATILIVGPLLGSAITEPAAMTISALILGRQFFDLGPSLRLKYATLGCCSSTSRSAER